MADGLTWIWIVINTHTDRSYPEYLGAFRMKADAVRNGYEYLQAYSQFEEDGLVEPLDYNDKAIRDEVMDVLDQNGILILRMILK